jgi:thiosulfate/3-mercaptopyruvate sulfurtransferase
MIRLALAALALPGWAAAQVVVSAEWLKRNLATRDLVVLHTAMQRADYDAGHLPGARFADAMVFHAHGSTLPPPERMAAELGSLGVSNRSRVVIVGEPMTAALVFVALDYLGHGARTSVLDGGLPGWKAVGGAVSTESVAPERATFSPRSRQDLAVTAEWVEARRAGAGIALVDARSSAEYAGTTDVERLPRAGHIPGAGHVDWLDTFAEADGLRQRDARHGDNTPFDGKLVPLAELKRRFEAAGVAPGDTVVAYCTVGMRASHLYVVAKHLGYPARLYVGSMADWTSVAARPVTAGSRP